MLLLILIILLGSIFLGFGIKRLKPYEKGVIERLGRYKRTTKKGGLILVIPIIDRLRRVSMRARQIDLPIQRVFTKDNVEMEADGVIEYEVDKPEDYLYNVEDFKSSTERMGKTHIRSEIRNGKMDEVMSSREEVNSRMTEVIEKGTSDWGVKIRQVYIETLDPVSEEVKKSLARQKSAEQNRLALVIESKGKKEAAENEGAAIITVASARAEARERDGQAIEKVIDRAVGKEAGSNVRAQAFHDLQTVEAARSGATVISTGGGNFTSDIALLNKLQSGK